MGQQAQRTTGFSGSSGEKDTSHESSFSSTDCVGAGLSFSAVGVGLSIVEVEASEGGCSDEDMRRRQLRLGRALCDERVRYIGPKLGNGNGHLV